MAIPSPLASLSPSIQNTKQKSPLRVDQHHISENECYEAKSYSSKLSYAMSTSVHQDTSEDDELQDALSSAATSPYKHISKRIPSNGTPSPIKVTSPLKTQSVEEDSRCAPSPPSESTLRFNEGLTQAIESQREETEPDDTTIHRVSGDEGMSTIMHDKTETNGDETGEETEITLSIDDTVNDISTFSAIADADLTQLAAQRHSTASPTKSVAEGWSPGKQLRHSVTLTPGTVKRPLQLSNRSQSDDSFDNDVTPRRPYSTSSPEDLLNFTGQSNIFIAPPQSNSRSSIRRSISGRGGFPIKINSSPTHRSQASVDRERSRGVVSPTKQTFTTPFVERKTNLLDFDLEPLATPRSIPSITPRELESLRSELSSQICSLSATLSGKEAEVLALKRAITDAEVRVGNTSEELRNEKSLREDLQHEKEEWDRRGRDMENVLREIRQEIMIGEHERDKLRRQTEEAEKKTEEMEVKVVELQTRIESAKRRSTLSPSSSPEKGNGASGDPATPLINGNGVGGMDINEAVREATERVARDLHSLYRGKHETKVAALKKSYEARWEKKVRHLEDELKSANTEISSLKTERDATMSGPVSSAAVAEQRQTQDLLEQQTRLAEDLLRDKEQVEADRKTLLARVAGMESEFQTRSRETQTLRDELEKERVEKGELVAQVDLFLALGDEQPPAAGGPKHNTRTAVNAPLGGGRGEPRTRSISNDSIPTSSPYPASRHTNLEHHPQQPQQQPQPQSPARPALNGRTALAGGSGRPRPMSMLQPPGKFSGIPGPGAARGTSKVLPTRIAGGGGGFGGGGGGIMEGIAKMGAGSGAGGRGY
jgi:predicted  nucleic acid-binding Zn-ribbon protein